VSSEPSQAQKSPFYTLFSALSCQRLRMNPKFVIFRLKIENPHRVLFSRVVIQVYGSKPFCIPNGYKAKCMKL